jgi:hypothetical protein
MATPDDATSEFVNSYIKTLLDRQAAAAPLEASEDPIPDSEPRRIANDRFREEMRSRFERLRRLTLDEKEPPVKIRRRRSRARRLLLVAVLALPVACTAICVPGEVASRWHKLSREIVRYSKLAFGGMENLSVYISRRICDWRWSLHRKHESWESRSPNRPEDSFGSTHRPSHVADLASSTAAAVAADDHDTELLDAPRVVTSPKHEDSQ